MANFVYSSILILRGIPRSIARRKQYAAPCDTLPTHVAITRVTQPASIT
jgi:hypothetical protein